MKKIVFVIERILINKWYAPLIDQALSRGFAVECWLDQKDISQTTKWYETPSAEKMPRFSSGTPSYRDYSGDAELARLTENAGDIILFTDRPPNCEKPDNQLWAHVVTTYFDSYASLAPKTLDKFDFVYCATEYWAKAAETFYLLSKRAEPNSPEILSLRKKLVPLGVPQFDHFAMIDRNAVRKKMGIPPDAKVVTVYVFEPGITYWAQRIFWVPELWKRLLHILILPISYERFYSKVGKAKFWKMLWWSIVERPGYLAAAFRDPSEKEVLLKIKEFCARNGYFLLFKYRKKYHTPRPYQVGLADHTLYEDPDYYPYTSAQVIAASDLLIANFSTAVGEAAYYGVPSIHLVPLEAKWQLEHQYRLVYKENSAELAHAFWNIIHNNAPGNFYNFPGVVNNMTVNELVRELPKRKLEDFSVNKEAAVQYRRKFLSPSDEPSAKLILNHIQRQKGWA